MKHSQIIFSWFIYSLLYVQLLFVSNTFDLVRSNALFCLIAVMVFIALGVGLMRLQGKRIKSILSESRIKVEELFLKIGLQEEDQQYVLKGYAATIVEDIESVCDGDGGPWEYKLTRYARNPDGEYFMLMFTITNGDLSKPYVKHVTQSNARFILKGKYVPPKNAA